MFLNCHSYYSLRYGTLPVEHLVARAKAMGATAMALTDINNSSGMPDFVKACLEQQIRPVAGIEFRDGDRYLYTGLAHNNEGFQGLNRFLSDHRLAKQDLPEHPPVLKDVSFVGQLGQYLPGQLGPQQYLGIRISELNRLRHSPWRHHPDRLLVWQPITFEGKAGYYLHQNLRAIAHNTLLTKLRPHQLAAADEQPLPPARLREAFSDFPEIISNTEQLLERCSISFAYKSYKNKKFFTASAADDRTLLEKLAYDGFRYRYRADDKKALQRLRSELQVIDKLNFSSYFLITWDIIRYSMSRGFYHVGRGSGANSVVAYCLRITDVDPIDLDLYFERFINPRRSSPPDFDIDYSWKDRDEVIDYIFKRYGREHTALLGTMTTFRGKSIYRELGKVHGLPKEEIDRLVENPSEGHQYDDITRHIHAVGQQMVHFPNQRSIHAGGILISEEPITSYTALDLPPKGFPTTQWDMYVAEDLGFEKLDILSQRGIGHIREAVEIIRSNQKVEVDAHAIQLFKKDPRVRYQLKRAETNGCFYIESPAMRGLLRKLRCDNYLSLVAASSIIRPGVAKSGMMREYIHRFHNPDAFAYIHPIMEEQLKETYGVMVYQEDVLKVCHHFAGLDLADADVLRRAMSGKYRGKKEFQRIVDKFFSNCRERGHPEAITREVWRQIESFAGYSFSKAHSASYAVESFQSLYLKAHYPLEFQVAVINNFGGFYHTWVYFNEARRQGAQLELPCVNNSLEKTTIQGTTIYAGFVHVASLERKLSRQIVEEREAQGDFLGLYDFIDRMQPGLEQLLILIKVGAFRFTGLSKSQLLWKAHLYRKKSKLSAKHVLFREPPRDYKLPGLKPNWLEDLYDEIEWLGFTLSRSYFDLLKTSFRGELKSRELEQAVGRKVRMVGQLVTIKYVRTVKKEMMHFATFLDDEGEFFDTTHFPDSLNKYRFGGYGVYLVLGKVVEEFGFPSIEVEKMAKLEIKPDPRA